MSGGARVVRPDRQQLRWDTVDLESQLPPDHRARLVWEFVSGFDLEKFYARIKARDDRAGRPASDPAVVLAVWLYATVEGVGSAREIDRLCRQHTAYRWLCGGVPVNHDILSTFRRESGAELDGLLTRSLTGLIAEGLVSLEEVAIDGTKVRARAGRGSMAGRERLAKLEAAVGERVARLKRELEEDSGAGARRQKERAARAAAERAERVKRAQQVMADREREKAQREKQHAGEAETKREPQVSVSDPQVRLMQFPDKAVRPGWNVQVATAKGFVVAIEPTDRRNDAGLACGLVAQVQRRCGGAPARLLADGNAMTQADIVKLAEQRICVFSPVPKEREQVTPSAVYNRRWRRRHEPQAVQDWRQRMASEFGKLVYRRRKLTEHPHAKMKNRGFGQMLVDGLAKVGSVCLIQALTHNLLRAHYLRCNMA